MNNLVKAGCAAGVLAAAGVGLMAAQLAGPSTLQPAYVVPVVPSAQTESLLSVGDSVFGYRMVGIPDGLGAFDNGNGTLTLLMNHELGSANGVIRAHGSKGTFVSKWVIDKQTLNVISGADLMKQIYPWDVATQKSATAAATVAFNRFCSGDLPAVSAFYNAATGKGTATRIYLHGEEGGATGYQLGTVVTGADAGKAYVLGKFNLTTNGSGLIGVGAWENAVANPYAQDQTVVAAMSDGGTGIMNNAVAIYVGTKQTTGSEIDKAGLTNGRLSFINVAGSAAEIVNTTTRATNITSGNRFSLSSTSSTTFSRPEDGAWNPLNPSQLYFVTTDQLDQVTDGVGAQNGRTRLWRLTFDDITRPELGGVIDLLVDGDVVDGRRVNMFDNLTVNATNGLVLLQEDTGNSAHNAKIWAYDPASDALTLVAKHDVARFGDIGVAAKAPFTVDEESSGIVDVQSILGVGKYLFVTQAHYPINATTPNGFANPDELVEGGQLQILDLPLPVAADKDRCKEGGWQSLFREDGGTFKNQGDCIQYVNTGK